MSLICRASARRCDVTTAQESAGSAAAAPWVQLGDAALAAGLRDALHHSGWCAITLEAATAAPTALADALPAQPRVLWRARDGAMLAGIGAAIVLRGDGDQRFKQIAAQAQALRWNLQNASVVPRFFGGFAFCNGAADEPAWQGFGDAWFILPRWNYQNNAQGSALTLFVSSDELHRTPHLADQLQAELATLRELLIRSAAPRPGLPVTLLGNTAAKLVPGRLRGPDDQSQWRSNIDDIVTQIRSGAAAKIVAARHIDVTLPRPLQLTALVETLWAQQPHCFGIAMSPGDGAATFVAAPPERLMEKVGAKVACEALAGSMANAGDATDRTVLLRDTKNRAEHQWVIDAVAADLTAAGVTLAADQATTVRSYRNIHHLHTPIAGTMATPQHVLELVQALHPTPAVGGTPRASALNWISSHESPRGYYASPVGWFSPAGDGEFAVAIRCALLSIGTARLWAGAGIVAASDADVEFAETQTKLQTMLGALDVEVSLP